MIDFRLFCVLFPMALACVHRGILHNANKPLDRATTNAFHFHRFILFLFEGRMYPVQLIDFMVNTKRSCKRLIYHGAVYGRINIQKGVTYWRCIHWLKGCPARFSTRSIDGRQMTNKPNHRITHSNHSNDLKP